MKKKLICEKCKKKIETIGWLITDEYENELFSRKLCRKCNIDSVNLIQKKDYQNHVIMKYYRNSLYGKSKFKKITKESVKELISKYIDFFYLNPMGIEMKIFEINKITTKLTRKLYAFKMLDIINLRDNLDDILKNISICEQCYGKIERIDLLITDEYENEVFSRKLCRSCNWKLI